MVKPQHADGEKIILDDKDRSGSYKSSQQTIVAVESKDIAKAAGRGVATIIKVVLGFIILLCALYLALSSTLMGAFANSIEDEKTEWTWVSRNVFVGGIPERGDIAFVSLTNEVSTTYLDKLKQTFTSVPEPSVVEVIAGPFSNVGNSEQGEIFADGESTGYFLTSSATGTLNNQYLVACLSGTCEEGQTYVIGKEYIVGRAEGIITTKGLVPFDSINASTTQ